jgi:hypothetical protein
MDFFTPVQSVSDLTMFLFVLSVGFIWSGWKLGTWRSPVLEFHWILPGIRASVPGAFAASDFHGGVSLVSFGFKSGDARDATFIADRQSITRKPVCGSLQNRALKSRIPGPRSLIVHP